MNTGSTSSPSSNSNISGTVDQVSLKNYSDTAVYAANKILPSIVGIMLLQNFLYLVHKLNLVQQLLVLEL